MNIVIGSYQYISNMPVSIRHTTTRPPCPKVAKLYQGTMGVDHCDKMEATRHLSDIGFYHTAKLDILHEKKMDYHASRDGQ